MLDRDMSNYKAIKATGRPWIEQRYTEIPEGSTYHDVIKQVENAVWDICKQLRYDAYYPSPPEWHHSGLFCDIHTIQGKVCVGVSFT